MLIPWTHALSYRVMMGLKEYCALTIPITRDRSSPHNRVFIDSEGRPRIRYQLTTQGMSDKGRGGDGGGLQHGLSTKQSHVLSPFLHLSFSL